MATVTLFVVGFLLGLVIGSLGLLVYLVMGEH